MMHFGYGTCWGVARGALDLAGVRGPLADLAHFGAIWGTAQIMLPANNISLLLNGHQNKLSLICYIMAFMPALLALPMRPMRQAEKSKRKKVKIF